MHGHQVVSTSLEIANLLIGTHSLRVSIYESKFCLIAIRYSKKVCNIGPRQFQDVTLLLPLILEQSC